MALTDKLTAIADAIRAKTGKTDVLTLDQMVTEIEGITTGGGVSPEESSIFDPTKETILVRSAATQREVFLTKTTIAYINSGKYAGYLGCKFDAVVGNTYRISWENISSSEDFMFYCESDEILTQVDDHYGTRIQHTNNPFMLTATKPYVYLWLGHPSVPSTDLVLVTGLMVHEVEDEAIDPAELNRQYIETDEPAEVTT